VNVSAPLAFILAATVNYLLCISILFRHRARWNSIIEILFYIIVVGAVCLFDLLITKAFLAGGFSPAFSKIIASGVIFILNFAGRRFLIFPEPSLEPWKPQIK
jgi:putative flippase GtrA